MMYSKLKYYVKTNLKNPSLDFVWNEDDNKKFFAYLYENFPSVNLEEEKNISEIKRVFEDYFEPVGYIIFKLRHNQIRLRAFSYKVEPKDSQNLESIIDIIIDNEDLIDFCYKDKDNQILVPSELVNIINDYIKSIKNEKINKKELLKFSVRVALELEESDIVVSKNGQIFIKLVDEIDKRQISEEEKNTVANRYNGIDEKEFETVYIDYFKNHENEDFFPIVAKLFVEKYFYETKINNVTYEKNVFSYIQNIIIEQLADFCSYNDEFLKGFSGYVFRKHFNSVFEFISDLILIEISASNEYMIDFLKYYSLNIVIINGVKYRVPELITEDGLKWNVVSMLSIVKIYIKTRSNLKILKSEIYKLDEKILALSIEGLTPLEYQKKHAKDKQKVLDDIAKQKHKLEKYSDSLQLSENDKEKQILRVDIENIKIEIDKLNKKKAFLATRIVKKSIIKNYVDLTRDKDSLTREQRRDEKIMGQNAKAFNSIKSALTKALISKKERI